MSAREAPGDKKNVAGLRVLLVEDESLVAMMAEEMLEALGCRVVATEARVEAALKALAGSACDLALLDINVAGKPVYPVADECKARRIPFLFVTGYAREGLDAAFRDRPFLRKPFHLRELANALGAAIEEHDRAS